MSLGSAIFQTNLEKDEEEDKKQQPLNLRGSFEDAASPVKRKKAKRQPKKTPKDVVEADYMSPKAYEKRQQRSVKRESKAMEEERLVSTAPSSVLSPTRNLLNYLQKRGRIDDRGIDWFEQQKGKYGIQPFVAEEIKGIPEKYKDYDIEPKSFGLDDEAEQEYRRRQQERNKYSAQFERRLKETENQHIEEIENALNPSRIAKWAEDDKFYTMAHDELLQLMTSDSDIKTDPEAARLMQMLSEKEKKPSDRLAQLAMFADYLAGQDERGTKRDNRWDKLSILSYVLNNDSDLKHVLKKEDLGLILQKEQLQQLNVERFMDILLDPTKDWFGKLPNQMKRYFKEMRKRAEEDRARLEMGKLDAEVYADRNRILWDLILGTINEWKPKREEEEKAEHLVAPDVYGFGEDAVKYKRQQHEANIDDLFNQIQKEMRVKNQMDFNTFNNTIKSIQDLSQAFPHNKISIHLDKLIENILKELKEGKITLSMAYDKINPLSKIFKPELLPAQIYQHIQNLQITPDEKLTTQSFKFREFNQAFRDLDPNTGEPIGPKKRFAHGMKNAIWRQRGVFSFPELDLDRDTPERKTGIRKVDRHTYVMEKAFEQVIEDTTNHLLESKPRITGVDLGDKTFAKIDMDDLNNMEDEELEKITAFMQDGLNHMGVNFAKKRYTYFNKRNGHFPPPMITKVVRPARAIAPVVPVGPEEKKEEKKEGEEKVEGVHDFKKAEIELGDAEEALVPMPPLLEKELLDKLPTNERKQMIHEQTAERKRIKDINDKIMERNKARKKRAEEEKRELRKLTAKHNKERSEMIKNIRDALDVLKAVREFEQKRPDFDLQTPQGIKTMKLPEVKYKVKERGVFKKAVQVNPKIEPFVEIPVEREVKEDLAEKERRQKKYSYENFLAQKKIKKEEPEIRKAEYPDGSVEYNVVTEADLIRMKHELASKGGILFIVELRTGRLHPIDLRKAFIGQTYLWRPSAEESFKAGGAFAQHAAVANILRDEEKVLPYDFMRNGRDKSLARIHQIMNKPQNHDVDYRDQVKHLQGAGLWGHIKNGLKIVAGDTGHYIKHETVNAAKTLAKNTIGEAKNFYHQEKRNINNIYSANKKLVNHPSFSNLWNAYNTTTSGAVKMALQPTLSAARQTANLSDFVGSVPVLKEVKMGAQFALPPLAVADALAHGVKNSGFGSDDNFRPLDTAINVGDALIGTNALKAYKGVQTSARLLNTGLKIADKIEDKH